MGKRSGLCGDWRSFRRILGDWGGIHMSLSYHYRRANLLLLTSGYGLCWRSCTAAVGKLNHTLGQRQQQLEILSGIRCQVFDSNRHCCRCPYHKGVRRNLNADAQTGLGHILRGCICM